MALASVQDVLTDQLKDIYNAEKQLEKALPKMARRASHQALQQAFKAHLVETRGQIERLEHIADTLGIRLSGKKCKAMEGLIEEGTEVMEEDGEDIFIDAALIAAAQRVEHYEISAYGTARALAEHMGNMEVAELLQETLDEESATDEKLSVISLEQILPQADSGEEEEEAKPARKKSRSTPAKKSGKSKR